MAYRFAVSIDWNDYGWPVGIIMSLNGCAATGRDMAEMLDKLEDEVRALLIARGESTDVEIELVGHDLPPLSQ